MAEKDPKPNNVSDEKKISIQEALDKEGEQLHISELQALNIKDLSKIAKKYKVAEIGKMNNITVAQQDINRAMVEEARRFPGQEHLVVQYFQKNPQAIDGLRAPIFEDKVVDFILELAKVTDRAVSVEELRRDPDAAPEAEETKAASEAGEGAKAKAKRKPAAKPAARKKSSAKE